MIVLGEPRVEIAQGVIRERRVVHNGVEAGEVARHDVANVDRKARQPPRLSAEVTAAIEA